MMDSKHTTIKTHIIVEMMISTKLTLYIKTTTK